MKRTILIAVMLIAAVAVMAQDRLVITERIPVTDGVVENGEYSVVLELQNCSLYLSRTAAGLYAALKARSDGWVAVGFGSSRMNEAAISIGYVKQGKEYFTTQKGAGHSHKDSPDPSVTAHALREEKGVTVLEIALDANSLIVAEQKTLSMIVAYGGSDGFTMYHSFRKGLEIGL